MDKKIVTLTPKEIKELYDSGRMKWDDNGNGVCVKCGSLITNNVESFGMNLVCENSKCDNHTIPYLKNNFVIVTKK